jgi:hypothetical protein
VFDDELAQPMVFDFHAILCGYPLLRIPISQEPVLTRQETIGKTLMNLWRNDLGFPLLGNIIQKPLDAIVYIIFGPALLRSGCNS